MQFRSSPTALIGRGRQQYFTPAPGEPAELSSPYRSWPGAGATVEDVARKQSANQEFVPRTRLFDGKNVRLGDLRRLRQQLSRLGKQSPGDLAIQVSIAPIFVGEGIEDAVLAGPQFDGIPA